MQGEDEAVDTPYTPTASDLEVDKLLRGVGAGARPVSHDLNDQGYLAYLGSFASMCCTAAWYGVSLLSAMADSMMVITSCCDDHRGGWWMREGGTLDDVKVELLTAIEVGIA